MLVTKKAKTNPREGASIAGTRYEPIDPTLYPYEFYDDEGRWYYRLYSRPMYVMYAVYLDNTQALLFGYYFEWQGGNHWITGKPASTMWKEWEAFAENMEAKRRYPYICKEAKG